MTAKTMIFRRGAENITNRKDLKEYKEKIKKEFRGDKITSEYFEIFDEEEPKNSNKKKDIYLNYASNIALGSIMGHKHGAIIVYKKEIISAGYNYKVNDNFSIHAEVSAIQNLKGKYKDLLKECELYVVRIGPDRLDNPLKYSKPCCNCKKTIINCGIKNAFYSTNYNYDIMV